VFKVCAFRFDTFKPYKKKTAPRPWKTCMAFSQVDVHRFWSAFMSPLLSTPYRMRYWLCDTRDRLGLTCRRSLSVVVLTYHQWRWMCATRTSTTVPVLGQEPSCISGLRISKSMHNKTVRYQTSHLCRRFKNNLRIQSNKFLYIFTILTWRTVCYEIGKLPTIYNGIQGTSPRLS